MDCRYARELPIYTDNLCIEKVSHYWLTLLVICMATYMPNFALVRVVITDYPTLVIHFQES